MLCSSVEDYKINYARIQGYMPKPVHAHVVHTFNRCMQILINMISVNSQIEMVFLLNAPID